jgi:hypothetical protein
MRKRAASGRAFSLCRLLIASSAMMIVVAAAVLRLLCLLGLLTGFLMRWLTHFLMHRLARQLGMELRPLRFLLRTRRRHLVTRLLGARLTVGFGRRLVLLRRGRRVLGERGLHRSMWRTALDMRRVVGLRLHRLRRRVADVLRHHRRLSLLRRSVRLKRLLRRVRSVLDIVAARRVAVSEVWIAAAEL